MELVCARLHRFDNHAAGVVAVIGRRVADDDVELLHRVGRRCVGNVVVIGLVDVHAVEDEVVVLLARAVHVGATGAECSLRRLESKDVGTQHARRQQRQLVDVARSQRQSRSCVSVDQRAHFSGASLQQRRSIADSDRLVHHADLQLKVDASNLIEHEGERIADRCAETFCFNLQLDFANRDGGEFVEASSRGLRGPGG